MTSDLHFAPAEFSALTPQQAVEALLKQAIHLKASDLYVLADEISTQVKVRRLGTVEPLAALSKEQGRQIINLVKVNANMDLAEQRRPLDGRFLYENDGLRVDLRVNCIPTLFGVDMTCRILDRQTNILGLDDLGMRREDLNNLRAMVNGPSGLILVTGPTGAGKTTTLYACLRHLNDGRRKINTLEDPVEYQLGGVRQSQVQPKIGVDFPELLRNVLRQAPDVIMVGEIRDVETAATAVRAANSGHLVLATLHAPVAAGAIQSMLALNVNPFFLATCLLGVVAQRLMRVLSPRTRIAYDISDSPATFAEITHLLEPNEGKVIYGPNPADPDAQEGYTTRTGLFEVMLLNQKIRKLVSDARPAREIEVEAIRAGMLEFRRAALLKVAQGVTSTEEMLRVVPSEYLGLED